MRTTLDIPEALIEEARQLLGFTSKTATVVFSLEELIRRRRIEQLKSLTRISRAGHSVAPASVIFSGRL